MSTEQFKASIDPAVDIGKPTPAHTKLGKMGSSKLKFDFPENPITLNALERAYLRIKKQVLGDISDALIRLGVDVGKCEEYQKYESKFLNDLVIRGSQAWTMQRGTSKNVMVPQK